MKKPEDEETRLKIVDYYRKKPLPEVLIYMNRELQIQVSPRTLRTWIKEWGARRRDDYERENAHQQIQEQQSYTPENVVQDIRTYDSPGSQHSSITAPGHNRTYAVAIGRARPDSPVLGHHVPLGRLFETAIPEEYHDEESPSNQFPTTNAEKTSYFWGNDPQCQLTGFLEPSQRWSIVSQDSGYASGSKRASTATSSSLSSSNYGHEGGQALSRESSVRSHYSQQEIEAHALALRPKTDTALGINNAVIDPSVQASVSPYSPVPASSIDAGAASPVFDSRSECDRPYCDPHSYPSVCPMARSAPYTAMAALEGCSVCNATRAHNLACSAHTWPRLADLQDQLHSVKSVINNRDAYGNSCVHFLASSRPNVHVFQLFRRNGAEVSATNMHGLSILHVLNVNSFQKVDQLIEFLTWAVRKGVNVRQRSRDGQTALHLMMQHLGEKRWADRIFDFFSQTELDIEARDRWGLKARDIFRGEKRGHQKRISAQALNDLDLKQKDQDMLQIVNNLAQDPLLEDSWGRNALGCLAYITRPMPDVPLLHQPAYARLNLLFFCLGFDMDVNHYDMSGSTALHSFVFKPRLEEYKDELTTAHFVRALINAGADVRLRDRNGDTALHLACKYGRINCVHALLHARSDLNAVNDGGRTVLAEARWWLEHGEDTDAAARVQMCMAEIHARGGKDVLENQNQCY